MLVYVAELLLATWCTAPGRIRGLQLPADRMFAEPRAMPQLFAGHRAQRRLRRSRWRGVAGAGSSCAARYAGFQLQVAGHAPRRRALRRLLVAPRLWMALLIAGALAGLAGALEVAGPIGQLTPTCRPATALPRSSSRSSAGCIRSASAVGAADVACSTSAANWRSPVSGCRGDHRRVPGPAAVRLLALRHLDPLSRALGGVAGAAAREDGLARAHAAASRQRRHRRCCSRRSGC